MTKIDYAIMACFVIVLALVTVLWVVYLMQTLWAKRKKYQTCIAKATVLSKQMNEQDVLEGDFSAPYTGTTYSVTFEVQDVGEREFLVQREQYQKLEEGQSGKIEFAAKRFCRFFDWE